MSKIRWVKMGWVAVLGLLFLVFSTWYGGNGKPLTPEQGTELLRQLRASYADTSGGESGFADNIEDMIARDDGKEFYAVNLEQLKGGEQAKEADRAYGRVVFPLLLKRGGHPVFVSYREGLMLGDYGSQVDRVAVVRYRSLRDLINMAKDPAMIAGSHHKFNALDHTEVFITRPAITFMHIRLTVALILLLIGWCGLKLIDLIATKRTPA